MNNMRKLYTPEGLVLNFGEINLRITFCTDYLRNITFDIDEGLQGDYVQNPMAYDTEVTSGILIDGIAHEINTDRLDSDKDYQKMVEDAIKVTLPYEYIFGIRNYANNEIVVFIFREGKEYYSFLEDLSYETRRQAYCDSEPIDEDDYQSQLLWLESKCKKYVTIQPYVHNLSYDFSILDNIHHDDFISSRRGRGATFARTMRRPMKANAIVNRMRINYRDSYVLVNKSLRKWCSDDKIVISKQEVEDENFYTQVRTPYDKLTYEEITYAARDVASMCLGLEKYKKKYGKIQNIPLTQTGAIRLDLYEHVSKANPEWAAKCYAITQSYSFEFFKLLTKAFQGGWTHANADHTAKIQGTLEHPCRCFDFASSYPAICCTEYMPIGQFEEVTDYDYYKSLPPHNPPYRWFAIITFKNVQSIRSNTYWSFSKVLNTSKKKKVTDDDLEDPNESTIKLKQHEMAKKDKPKDDIKKGDHLGNTITDNGRIYYAPEITCVMTDMDYAMFKKFYHVSDEHIDKMYAAEAGYFPKELIELILDKYSYKTSLKDVVGAESLYAESKEFINSIFGCLVTRELNENVTYDSDGWNSTEATVSDYYKMLKDKKINKTFGCYQHGVWVTSAARYRLFEFIDKFDERVVYVDTDSIKGNFTDEDLEFIKEYNKKIEEYENDVCNFYNIDPSKFAPKAPSGKEKRLGIMAREDDCILVSLGAKRYADQVVRYDENGNPYLESKIETTIAGLPKEAGSNKIKTLSDFLDPDLSWSTKESMKQICYYEDDQPPCVWIGRDGQEYYSTVKSGCCILPTTFDMSVFEEYETFYKFIEGEISEEQAFGHKIANCLLR